MKQINIDLIEKLLAKDSIALAKLISHIENRAAGYQEILDRVYAHTGRVCRIGITGPPGAGKSTLVDKLVPLFRAEQKTVGILACDPTSPFSGGALLGDRIRMGDISLDDGVFIRSMATRGSLGGLAKATQEVALLLEAFGFDIVILETIGVGQAEIDIVQAADTVVVVLTPQSGDAIQALKAGLMEIADIFVINKSDQGGADLVFESIHSILGFAAGQWSPPIVKAIAPQGEGISELKKEIEQHKKFLGSEGLLQRRKQRLCAFLRGIIEEELQQELWNDEKLLQEKLEAILRGNASPYQAAKEILNTNLRRA